MPSVTVATKAGERGRIGIFRKIAFGFSPLQALTDGLLIGGTPLAELISDALGMGAAA